MSFLELRVPRNLGMSLFLAIVLGALGFLVGMTCVVGAQAVPIGIVSVPALLLLFLIPELSSVPQKLMRRSFFVLAWVMIAVPDYYAIVLPPLPWISIRRLVLFTFVGSTLITLAGSGQKRRELIGKLRSSILISMPLIAFVVLSFVSTIQSVSTSIALGTLVNQMLQYYIPFIGAVLVIDNKSDVHKLFAVLVACVFSNCLIGAMEFHLKYPLMIHLLPPVLRQQIVASSPAYLELVNSSMIRNGLYRALSVYNTPLSWGEMSALVAPLAAYFIVSGESRRSKAFGALGAAFSLVSIFLSGSRGGYVGFILGMGLFFLAWSIRESRFNAKSLKGPYTLILYSMFCAVIVGAVFFVGKIHNIVLGGAASQASNDGRAIQWAMAWPRIWSRPILGYGPGTASGVVGFQTGGGFPTLDSYLINLLVGLGFPGAILFFFPFLFCIAASIYFYLKNNSAEAAFLNSIACGFLGFCVYRINLNQTENMTLVYILLGCFVALMFMMNRPYLGQTQP